ncbi:MAG: sel1 repeat family protein [Hyphomicrobiales bacterium]|nr:sel1 repeat family protein [Hyphomicrobiales bacterium]MDE2115046.1 sel1 repeat family protein [Hyphomicrobiales bacterium]
MRPLAPRHFKNIEDALRQGLEADQAGDVPSTLQALEYAAAGGQSLARWKLARMYEDGTGVAHNDLKAYKYYSSIVADYDPSDPDRRDRAVVSSAFVAMGTYALKGIPNTRVVPDPGRAMQMFQVAATEFRNAEAQYELARMFMDGLATHKDLRQAAGWLQLAAEKNHCQAQALLGRLLFNGGDGIPRQRARGLMWLSLAEANAKAQPQDEWIGTLYQQAMTAADDDDRQAAKFYLAARQKK